MNTAYPPPSHGAPSKPNRRQLEVLALLADNQIRSEIAYKLGIERSSVSTYAQQAAYCLGVNSVTAAVAVAGAYNYIPLAGGRIAVPRDLVDATVGVLSACGGMDNGTLSAGSAMAVQTVAAALRPYCSAPSR